MNDASLFAWVQARGLNRFSAPQPAKGQMKFSRKFVFYGALKALLLLASIPLPLILIAGCRQKTALSGDQPVAMRLRTPKDDER